MGQDPGVREDGKEYYSTMTNRPVTPVRWYSKVQEVAAVPEPSPGLQ